MIDPDVLIQTSRGNYHSFFLDLVDTSTGFPVNLLGYTLIATYRERGATPLLATTIPGPKLVATNPTGGQINLVIDEGDTQLLPSRDLTYCGCFVVNRHIPVGAKSTG
jgi:hypothetical protein